MFKKPVYPEVEQVKLKPFKGIRPGVYILILLFLFVLAILFVIGLLPGLVSPDAYIKINTPFSSVAIYEDGKYIGNASSSIYRTESGTHNYRLEYKGEVLGEFTENLERHYFFTLFSHHVQTLEPSFSVTEEMKNKATNDFLTSLAAYSAVTDYNSSYNYPPLFSSFAKDAVLLGIQKMEELWLYAAMHVTSDTMYKDYLEGKAILNASSISYSSQDLTNVENDLSVMFDENKNTTIQKIDQTSTIVSSPSGNFISYGEGQITLGKTIAVKYPETNLLPTTVAYKPFAIGTSVVSEYEYALFVAANPKWSKSNLESLKNEGLVDDYYLAGITLSTFTKSKRPIRNISWFAAMAYTEWLTESTGVQYDLPTEVDWTVAAKSCEGKAYTTTLVSEDKDTSTPIGMRGQLWEFTSTAYIPLGRVNYERAVLLAQEYSFDDIIVKGGSYANAANSIEMEAVGVLKKNTCSEFCGFRVVMR